MRVATALVVGLFGSSSTAQQKPPVKVPDPGVPQITTLEGEFVRIAYNNEGYVTMGYRATNEAVGQEWMLLEIGTTVRRGTQTYKLARTAITLETPDGKTHAMPTNADYLQVDLRGHRNARDDRARRDQLLSAGSHPGMPDWLFCGVRKRQPRI